MGNYHVRFQGEGVVATPLPYPTSYIPSLARLGISETVSERRIWAGRSRIRKKVGERTEQKAK